jgi:hypothetical protein
MRGDHIMPAFLIANGSELFDRENGKRLSIEFAKASQRKDDARDARQPPK